VKPGNATSSGASSSRRVDGPARRSTSPMVPAATTFPASMPIASTQP
jgi:hypothetical protein